MGRDSELADGGWEIVVTWYRLSNEGGDSVAFTEVEDDREDNGLQEVVVDDGQVDYLAGDYGVGVQSEDSASAMRLKLTGSRLFPPPPGFRSTPSVTCSATANRISLCRS